VLFRSSSNTNQHGFTLIELLITLAVSGILMAGVYTAFKSQQDAYLAQDQVAEMQQNIRAGLDIMIRDIRMAGYDPDQTGNYGIVDDPPLSADRIVFTLDNPDSPGDELELSYDLFPSVGVISLGRSSNGGLRSAIAENIESLEFRYLDRDGVETADVNAMRAVEITMVARSRLPDRNYTHPVDNDNFRRRSQTTTVRLRNMGL